MVTTARSVCAAGFRALTTVAAGMAIERGRPPPSALHSAAGTVCVRPRRARPAERVCPSAASARLRRRLGLRAVTKLAAGMAIERGR